MLMGQERNLGCRGERFHRDVCPAVVIVTKRLLYVEVLVSHKTVNL